MMHMLAMSKSMLPVRLPSRDKQCESGSGPGSWLSAWLQQVQDALKERSQRIYKEYGNVMLDTEGMSKVRRLPST